MDAKDRRLARSIWRSFSLFVGMYSNSPAGKECCLTCTGCRESERKEAPGVEEARPPPSPRARAEVKLNGWLRHYDHRCAGQLSRMFASSAYFSDELNEMESDVAKPISAFSYPLSPECLVRRGIEANYCTPQRPHNLLPWLQQAARKSSTEPTTTRER